MQHKATIFWFRRDLRLQDNAALYYALKENKNVVPVFIFDPTILNKLEDKCDRRVDFIYQVLEQLNTDLHQLGSSLVVLYDSPLNAFKKLAEIYTIDAVYANHDYEPAAIERDTYIREFFRAKNIAFKTYKDQCIFEKSEVVKEDGLPYTIFTPYSKKWKSKLSSFYLKAYPTQNYFSNFSKTIEASSFPSLQQMGFQKTDSVFVPPQVDIAVIKQYKEMRDIPSVAGTTKLSVHLRFGTVSIRHLAAIALQHNEAWLNELIWRDFYMMILFHFPHVQNGAFKPAYNRILWRNDENEFDKWCAGKTGYPIVDAGMRELNETGFMHNRVRMITASFLTKHLLINWQWGEAYFAKKLLDFELASNNGGWQWAASSGCDAAPYFRIFNPYEQTKRFDPDLKYIRKWIPELEDFSYPKPIVDHKFARDRVLAVYKDALKP
ncbi:MAG: deoxyribodipyrimidine photo-lyase [Bacteroidetes bacterium]|nr:deoxyribodipyrimidine photo-lyase [Bacteroidota bacterium]